MFVSEISSRRLQDMSSRHLQDMSARHLHDMSSRRLQDMSSRRLGRRKIVTLKTCWRRLQDQQMFAGIERAYKFLPQIYHCSTKWTDLGCKPHWSGTWKNEKKALCEKWLLGVLQIKFPKNFSKFTEKYLCGSLVLTMLKVFTALGLQLY